LPHSLQKSYKERSKIGITLKLLQQEWVADHLLAQITYEFGHLLLQSTHVIQAEERQKLVALGEALQMNAAQMELSEEMCLAFIAQSGANELLVYKQSTEASFAFKETSKRWLRIIGRNRERLLTEMRESKELMALLQKSTKDRTESRRKRTSQRSILRYPQIHAFFGSISFARRHPPASHRHETRAGTHPLCF